MYISHYTDFIYRSMLLTQKLHQQSNEEERFNMTLSKFYGHLHELVDPYDTYMSKLTKVHFFYYVLYNYCDFLFTSSSLFSAEHELFPNMTILLSVNLHCYKTRHGFCYPTFMYLVRMLYL